MAKLERGERGFFRSPAASPHPVRGFLRFLVPDSGIWAWYLITLKLGISIPPRETLKSWYYSHCGEVPPGEGLAFPGSLLLLRFKGNIEKDLTVALYFETVTVMMAAGLVFLASLFFLEESRFLDLGIPPMGLIPIFILAFLFLHPCILEKIFNSILRLLKREPLPSRSPILRCSGSWGSAFSPGWPGESVFIFSWTASFPFPQETFCF